MAVEKQQGKNEGGCTGKGFLPGKSGNPAGRPKKEHTFSDTAREIMSAETIDVEWTVEDGNGKKKTKRLHLKSTKNMHYGIAAALVMEALKGDTKAARELIDRIEGKAISTLELSGSDGKPIVVRFDGQDESL